MPLTMHSARQFSTWPAAMVQAARELHMPARGKRGSPENQERMRLAPLVAARALQILQRGELDSTLVEQ